MRKEFPPLYLNASYDHPDFKVSPALDNQIRDWCMDEQAPPLVFSGNMGVGKTHLAIALYRKIAKYFEWSFFLFSHELDEQLTEAQNPANGKSEADIIRKYAEAPFLVLDDLGAGRANDRAITQYFSIIDKRCSYLRKTLITTNLTPETLSEHMGERIANRLDFANWINFGGASKRSPETWTKITQGIKNEKIEPLFG